MNEQVLDRLLDAWMDLGPNEAPERVSAAASLEVRQTRQAHVLMAWAIPAPLLAAIGAAALLVAVVVGSGLIAGPGPAGPSPSASPTASPQSTPTASPTPTPRPRIGFVEAPYEAVIDRPSGWTNLGFAVLKNNGNGPSGASLSAWTIGTVYLDPCHAASVGSDTADPPLLHNALGTAQALSDWWGANPDITPAPDAPVATTPVQTTIAGRSAWYVELTTTRGATCDSPYLLWRDPSGGDRYLNGDGELDRLWIIDWDPAASDAGPGICNLPGGCTVLVVDAATFPQTSEEDKAALQAMIDSLVIRAAP